MFSKKKRVTKKLFLEIMNKGKVLSGSFFVFRYIKQKDPQYAIVAPKGVFKKANERNKYKRIGYSLLKEIDPQENGGIFFYKKTKGDFTKEEVKKDLLFLVNKSLKY